MKIKVKPSVIADQSGIFLDVYVENSYITRSDVPQPPIPRTDTTGTYNYTIRTSRSRSRVLLKSGQTTLIGGLIETKHEKEQTGVPYLQDIPVLGYLFKGTQKHTVDRELLIFITPTMIKG
jgi:type II secretory pathway component GspD/PulD (secretin)